MPASLTVFVVFGLVLVEPDFGTALFLLALALALLVLGGMRLHYLVLSAALFAPAIAVFAGARGRLSRADRSSLQPGTAER